MKKHIALLIVLAAFVTGCGKNVESLPEIDSKVGEIHAMRNELGSYSVFKILTIEEDGVHVRLYSNVYEAPPSDVDVGELYIAGDNRGADVPMGMGHMPVSNKSFATWETVYVTTVPVAEEELEGYKAWVESEPWYF